MAEVPNRANHPGRRAMLLSEAESRARSEIDADPKFSDPSHPEYIHSGLTRQLLMNQRIGDARDSAEAEYNKQGGGDYQRRLFLDRGENTVTYNDSHALHESMMGSMYNDNNSLANHPALQGVIIREHHFTGERDNTPQGAGAMKIDAAGREVGIYNLADATGNKADRVRSIMQSHTNLNRSDKDTPAFVSIQYHLDKDHPDYHPGLDGTMHKVPI